jgi:glucokinase
MPKNPSSESLVFAVDLGGTHLRVALVDENGRILEHTKQETPKGDSAKGVVVALVDAARQWESHKQAVVAASIMVPGAVDSDKAVVLQSPNLPSLVNFALKA